jgi:hypothetical protein
MPRGVSSGHLEALLGAAAANRFIIEVEPEPPAWQGQSQPSRAARREIASRRMRFRVMHEVAHAFFYDRSETVPRRLFPLAEP